MCALHLETFARTLNMPKEKKTPEFKAYFLCYLRDCVYGHFNGASSLAMPALFGDGGCVDTHFHLFCVRSNLDSLKLRSLAIKNDADATHLRIYAQVQESLVAKCACGTALDQRDALVSTDVEPLC